MIAGSASLLALCIYPSMMRKFLLTLLGVTGLLGSSIVALTMVRAIPSSPDSIVAQDINCNNAQTQVEMNYCARLSFDEADKRLNAAYQELLPSLRTERREKLINAQLEWIRFRDANCDFERSEVEDGSMASLVYHSCLENITNQRTRQLQEYLNWNR